MGNEKMSYIQHVKESLGKWTRNTHRDQYFLVKVALNVINHC